MSMTDAKVGFGWAQALAGRTGDALADSGITTVEISVLKSPAFRSKRYFNAQAVLKPCRLQSAGAGPSFHQSAVAQR